MAKQNKRTILVSEESHKKIINMRGTSSEIIELLLKSYKGVKKR